MLVGVQAGLPAQVGVLLLERERLRPAVLLGQRTDLGQSPRGDVRPAVRPDAAVRDERRERAHGVDQRGRPVVDVVVVEVHAVGAQPLERAGQARAQHVGRGADELGPGDLPRGRARGVGGPHAVEVGERGRGLGREEDGVACAGLGEPLPQEALAVPTHVAARLPPRVAVGGVDHGEGLAAVGRPVARCDGADEVVEDAARLLGRGAGPHEHGAEREGRDVGVGGGETVSELCHGRDARSSSALEVKGDVAGAREAASASVPPA